MHSTDTAVGSYIVCEYATGQSLQMIVNHGPLSSLEAAWITREVADALAGVHSLGLYHRRLSPETVIITPSGNIKIVGLLIEAALRPGADTALPQATSPEQVDVTDLGRLLYASLVCRWPGGPAFGLPNAPMVGRRWMSPRQVRAGVSPALDNVCDQILGDQPRHHAAPITTASGIVTALTKVLGTADAAPDLERRLRQPIPSVAGKSEPLDGAPEATPVSSLLTRRLLDNELSLPGRSQRPAHHQRPRRPGANGWTTPDRRLRPSSASQTTRRASAPSSAGAGSACSSSSPCY